MVTTKRDEMKSGYKIVVTTDDRPSEELMVTVAEVTEDEEWLEIIDTDGNHWQVTRVTEKKLVTH